METDFSSNIHLPPGFRFHPSDEELILHYLKNKATSNPLPPSIIAEVELYKFDPWELPKKAFFGEEEWYFFTPRDRKYPKGARPNRMAATGYWKATGTDRPVFSSRRSSIIGVKKALVFYRGRPPRGTKTEWIMDEYRLLNTMPWTLKKKESMRLDDWVLCRVRQKNGITRNNRDDLYTQTNEPVDYFPPVDNQISMNTNPNLKMLRDSLFKDCPMLPFIFGSQTTFFGKEAVTHSENHSNGENLQALISSFECLKNSKKRKNGERNQQDSSIQFQPDKKITERDDLLEELLSLSKDDDAIDTNIYSTNKLETNIFNADQWNSIMQYQELDQIAFA